MLKRVLSLVLALMLALSVVTVSYAAEDGWTDDLEFKYHVLSELGIVHADNMGGYAVFRDLSKNSFINFICNMYADYGYSAEYSADAIATAENMGIIHKGQDDLYKPLNYDEAMTMLVRLLGYGLHAEQSGGFPHGYIAIANKLGLSDGLRSISGGALQEYDGITLLYNAINAYYVEIVGIDESGIQYGGSSNRTFLYEFRKIYRVEGILQSSGAASIGTDIPNEEGKVIIGSYTYLADETYNEYLGMNVEAYVQQGDMADTVLLITPVHNDEILVKDEDIVSMSPDFLTFTYYGSSDNTRKAQVSAIASVIYNGQPIVPTDAAIFKPADGYVRLVDSRNEAGYDTIFITDYTTAVVESISKASETITSSFSTKSGAVFTPDVFELEEELGEIVRIYNGETEVALNELQPGDVLKIAESVVDGRQVLYAYLSRARITGTVTGYTTKEDNFITIDGTEYRMNERYEAALLAGDPQAKQIKIGSGYTFYLDNDGEIAYAKEVDGSVRYGLVRATADESKFGSDIRVRMFTQEGIWQDFQFADKVKYLGLNQNATVVKDAIDTAKVTKGYAVIAYTLGSDGKIRSVELPSTVSDLNDITDDDTFNTYSLSNDSTAKNGKLRYLTNMTTFGMKVYIDNNATLWYLDPLNLDDEEAYSVQGTTGLVNYTWYIADAYNVDRYGFANVFVIENDSTAKDETIKNVEPLVIEEVQRTLGSDGEDVITLTGMMGSYDMISFYCDEDVELQVDAATVTDDGSIAAAGVEGLQRGDVVSLYSDSKGYVTTVRVIHKVNQKELFHPEDTANMDSNGISGQTSGLKTHGMVKLCNHADNRLQVDCGTTGLMNLRTAANTLVSIYDADTDKLTRGTINDIEVGDYVVVRIQVFKVASIVVYKNM